MDKQFISTINGIDIYAVSDENHNLFVPVKPICDALNIAVEGQREKIQTDEILSSVAMLSMATGADGKSYEMLMLPLKFIYGWLFTINPKNVAPSAKENVIRYRRECYEVLYDHFARTIRQHHEEISAELRAVEALKSAILAEKQAHAARREAEQALESIRQSRLVPCPALPW